jgi:large subunit ribosomal protein L6e
MYHKKGIWAVKNKGPKAAKPEEKKQLKTKPFGKKGEKRTIQPKLSRFYPTEDIPKPVPSRKSHRRPTALRASITPGTVLILLAGRHQGKRVVFLKQLPSGLLLVTGPYKINGVPLRRVNQAYVIATSTKVDLTGVNVDAKFTDDYFRKQEEKKKKKTEEQFFAEEKKETPKISADRAADQKTVDAPILAAVRKNKDLVGYLKSRFALSSKQYPHELAF